MSYKLAIALLLFASTPSLAQPTEPTPTPEPEPTPVPAPEPTVVEPAPAPVVVVTTPAEPPPKKLPLEVKPGGYVHLDSRRLLDESEAHDITVRRLRFKLDGTATKYFKFRTLIDFAGSKLVVDDAWGEIVARPELALRFGKDKSQFGIERLQSATQLTFIERAFPTQLAPNRDIGAWLRGDIEKGLVHYAVGVVDGVANNAVIEGETDDVLELNLHLLISPFAKQKELGDLGIGGATTFGRTKGTLASLGLTNIKSAAQTTIVKYTTGMDALTTARADGYRSRFAAHAYYYTGPIGVLAEYVRDQEPIVLNGDAVRIDNDAWQVAASVAITPGDKPAYKGLKPKRSFDPGKETYGAVEVAARYSAISLDPKGFEAGDTSDGSSVEKATEFTLGANWYFNEYIKVQLDYSFTSFDAHVPETEKPSEHLIATRLQVAI